MKQLLLQTIIIAILATTTGCQSMNVSRRLMPTPIGIVAGLPFPGGEYSEACKCTDHETPVFVVSGRNRKENRRSPNPFGNERSQKPTLGTAFVTIGKGLSPEQLYDQTVTDTRRKTAKVAFSRIELADEDDSQRLFRGHDNADLKQDDQWWSSQSHKSQWLDSINRQLDRGPRRSITIFVHGYNTEFIDNTLIAAEIYHYLGHEGAMISFEWPSESRLLGYIVDKGNANFSTRQFRSMLMNLARECSADSITIIAHSAGSPIVVNALREIRLLDDELNAEQLGEKYNIKRVVLAAPDMDLMAFLNAIRDGFHEVVDRVAVYASPNDRALGVSERITGTQRLGRAVNNLEPWEKEILMDTPGLEMIDASVAEKTYRSLTRHNYFHRDPWVSSDIGSFILRNEPTRRKLVRQPNQVFWRFPSDYPDRLRVKAQTHQAP
jgi:esterase/lipase superfamily enzyme